MPSENLHPRLASLVLRMSLKDAKSAGVVQGAQVELLIDGRTEELQAIAEEGVPDGVVLLGKPDLYFTHKDGCHVIVDWKVACYGLVDMVINFNCKKCKALFQLTVIFKKDKEPEVKFKIEEQSYIG